jgi:hypothetical protein
MRASLAVAAFAGVAGLAGILPAQGAIKFWSNTAGGDFSTGANWTGGAAPAPTEGAYFSQGATYAVNFTDDVTNDVTYVYGGGNVTFNISSGKKYTLTGSSSVGVNQAALTVSGGGSLSGQRLSVGTSNTAGGDHPSFSVSGATATFTDQTYIGSGAAAGSEATVQVTSNASLATANTYLASNASYTVTATVDGNSTWATSVLYVGGGAGGVGGSTTLNVNGGGTISATNGNLLVYHTGTINLGGNATLLVSKSGKILDLQGGKLNVSHANNTITGNATLESDGTNAPVTTFTLGSLSDYGQLNISGTAALAGTLNVSLANGFSPTPGQTFTLLTATGGLGGTTFSTTNLSPNLSISYTPTSVILTAVPEPAALGLLGVGGLLALRRRR